jgi:hypothetical protein
MTIYFLGRWFNETDVNYDEMLEYSVRIIRQNGPQRYYWASGYHLMMIVDIIEHPVHRRIFYYSRVEIDWESYFTYNRLLLWVRLKRWCVFNKYKMSTKLGEIVNGNSIQILY